MVDYRAYTKELVERLLFKPTRLCESLSVVNNSTFKTILVENATVSAKGKLPLCQDTGLVTLFVGHRGLSTNQLDELRRMFEAEFSLHARPSQCVPFMEGTSFGKQQLVYLEEVRGRQGLGAVVTGAGTEAHAFLRVYSGTTDWKSVVAELAEWVSLRGALACPPLHISVTVGGTAAEAVKQTKMAFLFGDSYPASFADKVALLKESMANLNVDPMGGSDNWVGKVFVRVLPAHISAVPVALSFMCWPFRAEWIDLDIE